MLTHGNVVVGTNFKYGQGFTLKQYFVVMYIALCHYSGYHKKIYAIAEIFGVPLSLPIPMETGVRFYVSVCMYDSNQSATAFSYIFPRKYIFFGKYNIKSRIIL